METGSQEKGGTQAQSDTGDVRQGDNRQEDREKGRRGVGATRVYRRLGERRKGDGRQETGDRMSRRLGNRQEDGRQDRKTGRPGDGRQVWI